MFGHDAKPSRIFSYGALPPTENLLLVDEHTRRRHKLTNDRIALERRRRDDVWQLLLKHCPELAAAQAQAEAPTLIELED